MVSLFPFSKVEQFIDKYKNANRKFPHSYKMNCTDYKIGHRIMIINVISYISQSEKYTVKISVQINE